MKHGGLVGKQIFEYFSWPLLSVSYMLDCPQPQLSNRSYHLSPEFSSLKLKQHRMFQHSSWLWGTQANVFQFSSRSTLMNGGIDYEGMLQSDNVRMGISVMYSQATRQVSMTTRQPRHNLSKFLEPQYCVQQREEGIWRKCHDEKGMGRSEEPTRVQLSSEAQHFRKGRLPVRTLLPSLIFADFILVLSAPIAHVIEEKVTPMIYCHSLFSFSIQKETRKVLRDSFIIQIASVDRCFKILIGSSILCIALCGLLKNLGIVYQLYTY